MSADARLPGLRQRWQQARQQGQALSAEELCRDCPELRDEVRQQIEWWLLDSEQGKSRWELLLGDTGKPNRAPPSPARVETIVEPQPSPGHARWLALAASVTLLAFLPLLFFVFQGNPDREQDAAQQAAAELAKKRADAAKKENLPKNLKNSIGMKLVLIKPGKFTMGSPANESEREPFDEGSERQHEVEITKHFYMGVCEVTQAQYRKVMGENPSWFSASGGGRDKVQSQDTSEFPVENVSWHDAVAFCKKLSEQPDEKQAGRLYHLPTEAEWEYACRGGVRSPFHCGGSLSSRQANFNGDFPYGGAPKGPYLGRTTTVGSYQPNAFGLYDMHGNVWEWCADWYATDYNPNDRQDPQGPATGIRRVLRGGLWCLSGNYCRAAFRGHVGPGLRGSGVGFRVVLRPASRAP
jgi:formylglycine-generating enzyme required for sulfatase activity